MRDRARAAVAALLGVLMTAGLLTGGLLGSSAASAAEGRDTQAAASGAASGAAACPNRLVRTLSRAGFTGEDLREAWAIAMRESRGTNLGPGHPQFNGRDYGIFQFNRPTFGNRQWWNTRKLLTADYNARQAFTMSRGGKNWVLWGLDGKGRPRAHLYRTFGWSAAQIDAWVVRPYERFYRAYPC
jgi:Lysozyme like domain